MSKGEQLVVELAREALPQTDGAEWLEYVREVGGAIVHPPVEDSCCNCSQHQEAA